MDFICQFTSQFSNSYISLEDFGVGTVRITNQNTCDRNLVIVGLSSSQARGL